ncbi:hypothetical protein CYMTET_33071, partial [Cymbomonas tetramitiformis]
MRSMVDGAEGSAADDETGVSVEVPEFIEAETVSSTSTPVTTDTQCNLGLTGRGAISYIEKKWVARGDTSVQYMHMPTIAQVPSGQLVLAWQAAKRAEGANDQAIYYSYTDSAGDISTWSSPRKLPIPSGKRTGPQWSPVLFQPASGPLHLYYTESKGCWHCNNPHCLHAQRGRKGSYSPGTAAHLAPVWRAGGDLLVIKTNNLKEWSAPEPILLEEAEGPIPKVISNPPLVLGGRWLLPYWRQNPRGAANCRAR